MHWYSDPFRKMDSTFIQSAAALVLLLFFYHLFLHITRSKDSPGESEREKGVKILLAVLGQKPEFL